MTLKRFFLIALCLPALLSAQQLIPVENQAKTPILTPSLSERQVAKFRLPNGMDIYLVSDPGLDKSGAAMAVQVGSWSDPKDKAGTAHFLEHMLFLGTEKYPQESEYERYIFENNGLMNAYTAGDRTVYYFSVCTPALPEALDRFAQFFIAPLFNPSGVAREMHAIDQEYAKNIQNDDWRIYYIQKALGNQNHPNAAFSIGSLDTLAFITQDELKKWYKNHYSANIMHLVVESALPMETLKKLVVKDFSAVPNYNVPPTLIKQPLGSPNLEGHLVVISPYKDLRRLYLIWELPATYYYDSDIVCYALGHQGGTGLLSDLKQKGLADSLNCLAELIGLDRMFLTLEISLTDSGVENVDQVIAPCFDAIALLKEKPIPPYLFEEMHQMAVLKYEYQQRQNVIDTAPKDASGIIDEGLETYPEKALIPQKTSQDVIQQILEQMTPAHCQFLLIGKPSLTQIPPDQTEPWLGGKYAVVTIPSEKLTAWGQSTSPLQICYPPPNPFIPEHLQLVSNKKNPPQPETLPLIPTPTTLFNEPGLRIDYALDDRYLVPEIGWFFRFTSDNIAAGDPIDATLLDLYIRTLNDNFMPVGYLAKMANIHYEILPLETGFSLQIEGYSEKVGLFLKDLLNTMNHFSLTQEKFQTHIQALKANYDNLAYAAPMEQAKQLFQSVLFKNFVTNAQKSNALTNLQREDLLAFSQKLHANAYIQGMLYGNLTQQEAKRVGKEIRKAWGGAPYAAPPPPRQVFLMPGQEGPYAIEKEIAPDGNVALYVLENDCFTFKRRAAHQMLCKNLREPFYTELRTKQQTGYIVMSMEQEVENLFLSLFLTQSDTHAPRDLLARFELFLDTYLQDIKTEGLPPNRFEALKQSFIETYKQPPTNIDDMLTLLDSLAFDYDGDFQRLQKRLQGFQDLTYEEFLAFAKECLGKQNTRRLAILLSGGGKGTWRQKVVSPEELRQEVTYIDHTVSTCVPPP